MMLPCNYLVSRPKTWCGGSRLCQRQNSLLPDQTLRKLFNQMHPINLDGGQYATLKRQEVDGHLMKVVRI